MAPSVNRNYYFLAVRGTIPAIFIAFVFYYFSLIIDLHGLAIVGLVLSVLPLAWSFGEIASVRSKNLQLEGFTTIRTNFQNGIESVRSLLFYITFFVILFVVQLALNLTGWMPGAGISLLGVAINLNTLLSFLLILLTLIILFGILMVPTYRLYNYFRENTLSGTVAFISSVLKKGIQYIFVLIPSTLFGSILLIIPSVLLVASLWLTSTLKNEVLDIRLNQMQEQQLEVNDELQAYELNKNIEQLKYLKKLPNNLLKEMFNRNNLIYRITNTDDDIRKEEEKLLRLEDRTKARLKTLDDQITLSESSANSGDIASLKEQKLLVSRTFNNQKADIKMVINKNKIDLEYLHRNSQQIPILFFLAGIWISLFGGLVFSFATAYLGNVFYELYLFRNDGTPSYFKMIILHEKEKDNKQPLLGFSLLIIVIAIIYLLYNFGFPYYLNGI